MSNKMYTESQFKNSKSRDKLPFSCKECGKTFFVFKNEIQKKIKGNSLSKHSFCSKKCHHSSMIVNKILVCCKNCRKEFYKEKCKFKKSKNHFCSRSCSATYNNLHKKIGTRRSKLEKWIENKLKTHYSNLEIHYNQSSAINSELDIYIPSLKLAFELNGIYHYEPIHGIEKLAKIQSNDNRKFQACLEQGIELCIIDTSNQKYFKENTSLKFLNIIKDIIDSKLAG